MQYKKVFTSRAITKNTKNQKNKIYLNIFIVFCMIIVTLIFIILFNIYCIRYFADVYGTILAKKNQNIKEQIYLSLSVLELKNIHFDDISEFVVTLNPFLKLPLIHNGVMITKQKIRELARAQDNDPKSERVLNNIEIRNNILTCKNECVIRNIRVTIQLTYKEKILLFIKVISVWFFFNTTYLLCMRYGLYYQIYQSGIKTSFREFLKGIYIDILIILIGFCIGLIILLTIKRYYNPFDDNNLHYTNFKKMKNIIFALLYVIVIISLTTKCVMSIMKKYNSMIFWILLPLLIVVFGVIFIKLYNFLLFKQFTTVFSITPHMTNDFINQDDNVNVSSDEYLLESNSID